MKYWLICFLILMLTACSSNSDINKTRQSVYQQLGGAPKVAAIVDNFITEIEGDEIMLIYFEGADIQRFREKLNEHLCLLAGGGCEYTGDSMEEVHTGMNLTEGHFNHGVDLFINAMNKAKVPHRLQNKLLAVMVPERDKMIYIQ